MSEKNYPEDGFNDLLSALASKPNKPQWLNTFVRTLQSRDVTLETWNSLINVISNIASDTISVSDFLQILYKNCVWSVKGSASLEEKIGNVVLELSDFGINIDVSKINRAVFSEGNTIYNTNGYLIKLTNVNLAADSVDTDTIASGAVTLSKLDSNVLDRLSQIDTKLDKYTRNEDVVYTHSKDGRDDVTPYTDWYAGPSIMFRDSAGKSQVGTASDADDSHTIVNKEYLAKVADTKLDSKANKSTFSCVYAVNSLGDNTEIRYTASETANTIMMRDANGRANVETPVNPNNIVNKEYVDKFVKEQVAGIVNSAPETLDTLQELSKALGDDPNFATTVSTELGKKAVKTEVDAALETKLDKSNVVQTTGQSTTSVMSQKATTDEIDTLKSDIPNLKKGIGINSIAQKTEKGKENTASGEKSAAFNSHNIASGRDAFTAGSETEAAGNYSMAVNRSTKAKGVSAFSSGENTVANGQASHVGGMNTLVDAKAGTAFGIHSEVHGESGFASGGEVNVIVSYSRKNSIKMYCWLSNENPSNMPRYFSLSLNPISGDHLYFNYNGEKSTALTNPRFIIGTYEGIDGNWYYDAKADQLIHKTNPNWYCRRRPSEDGVFTCTAYPKRANVGVKANGEASMALGLLTEANGRASLTAGLGTRTTTEAQVAVGKYNSENNNALFLVGNGTSNSTRSNAFEVFADGTAKLGNDFIATVNKTTDYTNKTHYGYSGDDLLIIPEGTTTIEDHAYSSANYKYAVIPEGVTSIGIFAFSSCTGLTSITIPNSVTSIGNSAFINCKSLINITIPESVTSIGKYAFSRCSSLLSIAIPSSVTKILDGAFSNTPLKTIDLTAYVTESFPALGADNFNSITSDCQIKVVKGRKAALAAMTNWSAYADYIVEVPTVETLQKEIDELKAQLLALTNA